MLVLVVTRERRMGLLGTGSRRTPLSERSEGNYRNLSSGLCGFVKQGMKKGKGTQCSSFHTVDAIITPDTIDDHTELAKRLQEYPRNFIAHPWVSMDLRLARIDLERFMLATSARLLMYSSVVCAVLLPLLWCCAKQPGLPIQVRLQ